MISRRQLHTAGVSDRQVDRLAGSGALQPYGYGVWLAAPTPVSYESRLWQAILLTDGVLFARTAAHLWGMTDDAGGLVDIAVPLARRVTPTAGLRVRRTAIPAGEVTSRVGLPVTDRRRSAIDFMGSCRHTEAVAFADRALSQGWFSVADLERRLHTRTRGNPVVRRVLATLTAGAEAESERRLHRLLRRAGIDGWIGNHEVLDRGRFIARVDVAFPGLRLAIEVDGFAYHSDRDRFQRDRRRQNDLVALGWRVLRFTWTDLVERPEYVTDRIRQQLLSGEKSTA